MTLPPGTPDDGRLGQLVGNRWRLTGVLGTGSTATVYSAEDADHQRFAVKLLTPRAAQRGQTRQRLAREAEVSRLLTHDSLTTVHAYDIASTSESFIVMELLEGESMATRIARKPNMTLEELLKVAWQLLDVLAVAHAAGVVHRDVKPANVMLLPDGRLKLLDFGIARVMGEALAELPPVAQTELGVALGTIPYMAPEQAQGRRDAIDPRTDLYAVGAILFRVWSGRHLHQAETPARLLELMGTTQAPSLSAAKEDTPLGLTATVDLALRFASEARYPDARTMQLDVTEMMEGREPRFAIGRLAKANEQTVLPGPAEPIDEGAALRPPEPIPVDPEPGGLEGTVLAGRYLIDHKLGAGGMGAVYLAEHMHMRKAVAVKVLHRELTYRPEVVARFEREAIAAARIEHPNVVTAKDFGRLDNGSFYLVLEYVQGTSLRSTLATQGRLSPERALSVTRQIAQALDAAHRVGIVHRDLKPENVMLLPQSDGSELVKVLDFGIAKVSSDDGRDSELTKAGAVFGTPAYMSPEQAAGQAVDQRTDLYTLGIVLYEMLSSQTPFTGGSPLAVLTAQLTEPPPKLPIRCDPGLESLVARLLCKDPAGRCASAAELLRELDSLAAQPQHLARPRASLPSMASTRDAATRVTRKWLRVIEQLRSHAPGLASRLAHLAKHELRVGPLPVRVWQVGVIAMLCGAALVAVPALFQTEAAPPQPTSAVRALPSSVKLAAAKLDALTRRAKGGDRAALEAIARVLPTRLGPEQWLARGLGWARLGEVDESVSALEKALQLSPELQMDKELVGTLLALIETSASERVLQVFAGGIGEVGTDLLYELWQTRRQQDSPAARALANRAQTLLGSAPVRRAASPALVVALDLRLAKSCHDYSKLLGVAARDADARSEPMLRRLTATRGCGFLGLGDCYDCLRDRGALLTTALRASRARPAPTLPRAAKLSLGDGTGRAGE